jgi:heparin binding hemagglutinin HbhA
MTEQTNTRIPAPLYAAAGAGDLAYEQLRKLPAVIDELSVRVNEFSGKAAASLRAANQQAGELRTKAGTADFDKLRDTATNNAVALAQEATERALAVYTALVARGERVVGTGVIGAADVVNADLVTTEEPKAAEAGAAASEPTPRKRATKAAPAAPAAPAKRSTTK